MDFGWKGLQRSLVFAVNGDRFELEKVDPSTTLLEFLRTQTRYKGTKLGCGEGGCGACVVLLATYDPQNEQVKECSVSSCLTLICSINFCAVTTTEGLGSTKDGFHSIHKRFSGFHASQCGFCTPGMCMSLFSALRNAEKKDRPTPPTGFSKLTTSEAQKAILGNLCRCTGYRPIVDVCKSFAADVDLEDLGLNTFWKRGEKGARAEKLPLYRHASVSTFPEFLKLEIKSALADNSALINNGTSVNGTQMDMPSTILPTSLAEGHWHCADNVGKVFELLNLNIGNGKLVKLVAGNTGAGVYKEGDFYDVFIDLRGIPELSVIRWDVEGIQIGATVTISRAIQALKERKNLVFDKIADHMSKVASEFIRNTATLGGNLILAQRNQLPSDIATILLAVDLTVCIQTHSRRLVVSLEEFLEKPTLDSCTLLLSIHIPYWTSAPDPCLNTNDFGKHKANGRNESKLLFETYRASPRPMGNAVAYLNSAFLACFSLDKASGDFIFDDLRLAFGAFGNTHAIRTRQVENFLVGKPVSLPILLDAIKLLKKVIIVKEGTAHRDYRLSLGAAFLFDFLHPICKGLIEKKRNEHLGLANGAAPETLNGGVDACLDKDDLVLSSQQLLEYGSWHSPIAQPTKKAGAELQASGEAIYVDDILSPRDCLFGAFIYSTRPLARINGISFKPTKASQTVMAVISVADIPKGGENVGTVNMHGMDPLFADSIALHVGQPLGLVIAESQKLANMGAQQAVVDYSTENLETPILSVEEAVQRSSFFELPPYLCPEQIGDLTKGMAEADHKILSAEIMLPSQYYFYMETQTALAIPDEDNCLVVYSSTQFPEDTGIVIAKCVGIPVHNVRVITRRVGGGFGGKATRAIPVATACALAAHKLRRPVRLYLDRKTDIIMAGGRHPMKIKYSVGFKSDGTLTALHVDLLIDAGIFLDYSQLIVRAVLDSLRKYNWGALSFDVKLCKTNLPSKSAMRAPGDVQGSFIAEAVIEHVASSLCVSANIIRQKNLHSFESLGLYFEGSEGDAVQYTLPSLLDKLMTSANYSQREDNIRSFNSSTKWKKRGISLVPVVYPVRLRPTPGKVGILRDGSVVIEVGGIELGQGLWTKVRQIAAFTLGQLWSHDIPDLLEKLRVIQGDTLSLIQGGMTAGSTTSESCCEAVHVACSVLVDRLKPLKDKLQEQMGSITWEYLIFQASLQSVNLSASTLWIPEQGSSKYLNYGAALSEVEIDLLTGGTTILQTDIVYDCGQSLNPAVDLGQIEGAFVQGIGFFMCEEYLSNTDGLVISDGTWTYKIPTVDTIPKKFNVEILSTGHHKYRILSSKASGEPPLLLAASVHCATREAIKAARTELLSSTASEESPLVFQLKVPATMPVVKELCGLDNVEKYLEASLAAAQYSEDAC